ncbi:MAG TPA: hypothetical protein VF746_31995 [Longimicrobium sp.]|jgi:hypothetical protein
MGWWNDLFRKRAQDWVYAQLDGPQVPDEPKEKEEVPVDGAYLTITLRSLRVVNVRRLATKFYGVVHSFATLNHLSGKDASFHTVTSPAELRNIDPANLDRVITVKKTLLGPIPYRGEGVGLELGLFSIKEADLAAPFIDLLESASSAAGVSVVSTALPFIEPLRKGIDAITGASGDSILEIGISDTYNPPRTGWWVVMRARKGTVDVSKLRVTPTDFRLVDADGQPVRDYPYVVFSISQSGRRDDWFKLPDLTRPYQELREAARKGDYEAVKELIATFKRTALTSDDLITADAMRIGQLVQEQAEAVLGRTMTARSAERDLPPLESYPLYA